LRQFASAKSQIEEAQQKFLKGDNCHEAKHLSEVWIGLELDVLTWCAHGLLLYGLKRAAPLCNITHIRYYEAPLKCRKILDTPSGNLRLRVATHQ
jgi:hypothetical protein